MLTPCDPRSRKSSASQIVQGVPFTFGSPIGSSAEEECVEKGNKEQSLYWLAIQQLPTDPLQEMLVGIFDFSMEFIYM